MTNQVEQTDIFSLFGIDDEYAEKKKAEAEELKKSIAESKKKAVENASKPSTTTKAAGDLFEVNENTIIKYYVEEIPITQYFSDQELVEGIAHLGKDGETTYKKIDGEELRKRMENDYAQFISGMTEMVYIKKKNIVIPIIQAKKKGNCGKDCTEDSFESSSNLKRIPFHILRDFIAIARHFGNIGVEVHADIYFDAACNEFFMMVPEQKASKYWVTTIEEPYTTALKLLDKQALKVMEIHSHHYLTPIPSLQDDESERLGILYAIVGNIGEFFPKITCRTFSLELQKHIPLNPWQVFESPFKHLPDNQDISVVEVC